MNPTLIDDATAELNSRQRGKEARQARLATGGVPLDHAGMAAWLATALDAQLESAGGVYHVCTARIANGVDPDLLTLGRYGCRVTRVPISASPVAVGDVCETVVFEDGSEEIIVAESPFYVVRWGSVGAGYMGPVYDYNSFTAEEAERRARSALLARGDCFSTRQEATDAAENMLRTRAARALAPKPKGK